MDQKISSMPEIVALVGDEFVPGINSNLENVRIPVALLGSPSASPSMMMLSMTSNVSTSLQPTQFWNDWTVQSIILSPDVEWDAYSGGILCNVAGIFRVTMTTKISCTDFYGNPASLPLNMAVGTHMDGANTLPPDMNLSRIALTGDAVSGLGGLTFGQWTDEYIIESPVVGHVFYPRLHWHPLSYDAQQADLRAIISVQLIQAEPLV